MWLVGFQMQAHVWSTADRQLWVQTTFYGFLPALSFLHPSHTKMASKLVRIYVGFYIETGQSIFVEKLYEPPIFFFFVEVCSIRLFVLSSQPVPAERIWHLWSNDHEGFYSWLHHWKAFKYRNILARLMAFAFKDFPQLTLWVFCVQLFTVHFASKCVEN